MCFITKNIVVACLSIIALGISAGPGAAEEKYYMVIFASQSEPKVPWLSHTFATFVKVAEPAGDGAEADWEFATISWLPTTGVIALARPLPEPGKNFDLAGTLKWAKSKNARIAAWGPYQVKKELFESAQRQIERLNSGQVEYKAISLRLRDGVSNCIQAVSDIDAQNGFLFTGTAFGDAASLIVAQYLKRWIINPQQTYPWVTERLGLKSYDVRYEKLPDSATPPK